MKKKFNVSRVKQKRGGGGGGRWLSGRGGGRSKCLASQTCQDSFLAVAELSNMCSVTKHKFHRWQHLPHIRDF